MCCLKVNFLISLEEFPIWQCPTMYFQVKYGEAVLKHKIYQISILLRIYSNTEIQKKDCLTSKISQKSWSSWPPNS